MVGIAIDTGKNLQDNIGISQAEAPEFEKVTWYKDAGLRKLYFWAAVLCIASATTGYDGCDPTQIPSREPEANVCLPE